VKHESLSHGLDEHESLDVVCVEYESFYFDPIISDPIFEPSKSECLKNKILCL